LLVPDGPRVDEAHRIMQDHMYCVRDPCARKAAALRVLVLAARYVLVDWSSSRCRSAPSSQSKTSPRIQIGSRQLPQPSRQGSAEISDAWTQRPGREPL